MKLIKNTNKGFTIIEVLIVLAIASSVLLVVFLAVPALQRNSRNASYRQEAQRILGAVQENSSNNNATPPTASSCAGATCLTATPTNDANRVMLLANSKNITDLTIEANAGTTQPTLSRAVVRLTSKCSGNSVISGTGRQVALLYSVEDSSGNPLTQCTSS